MNIREIERGKIPNTVYGAQSACKLTNGMVAVGSYGKITIFSKDLKTVVREIEGLYGSVSRILPVNNSGFVSTGQKSYYFATYKAEKLDLSTSYSVVACLETEDYIFGIRDYKSTNSQYALCIDKKENSYSSASLIVQGGSSGAVADIKKINNTTVVAVGARYRGFYNLSRFESGGGSIFPEDYRTSPEVEYGKKIIKLNSGNFLCAGSSGSYGNNVNSAIYDESFENLLYSNEGPDIYDVVKLSSGELLCVAYKHILIYDPDCKTVLEKVEFNHPMYKAIELDNKDWLIVLDNNDEDYVILSLNTPPTISDNTSSNRTLYEGDVITLNGNVKDEDKGDVVTLRYNINNGTTRALSSNISQGRDIPYNKTLTFKEGYLYDVSSKVSSKLSDGTKHLIKLWATDDNGGKSKEVLINFYVVNNRPASLVINSMVEQHDLIDTDTYLITGSVKDPDGNETTLSYKVNSSSYSTISSGKDRDFEVRIPVSRFNEGNNTVTFRAKDTYGAITEKVAKITKDKNITPLKTAIREYKMLPPDGKAKGVLIWIQREVGDLTTKVEIKFGSSPYKTLESDNTAPVGAGIEEDEYYYEHDTEEEDIRLRITMERSSLSSTKGIKLISGVFN